MAKSQHGGFLGASYGSSSPEEIARIYDDWAGTYDEQMAKFGYRHPTIGLALLARHVPKGATPLLDVGAGTGLLGEWLGILGYPEVEALDVSEGMLAIAAQKNVYAALHQLALGGPLPFADHAYAAIIAVGVFSTGHVGPEALDELIRICQPGGVIILTVKNALWTAGFADYLVKLETAGKVTCIEETPSYVSMPGEAGTTPSHALVLRIS